MKIYLIDTSPGGVLIAGLRWRAIFLINVPLGILTFSLTYRYLPADHRGTNNVNTLLLALTLAAYALAMTIGRGSFGPLNIALLLTAVSRSRPLRTRRIESRITLDPLSFYGN